MPVAPPRHDAGSTQRRKRRAKRFARRFLPFVGLCLIVYWIGAFSLTHMPITNEAGLATSWKIPHGDKFVHLGIYTGLAFLMSVWFGVRRGVSGAMWVALFVSLILAGYAAFDEITQAKVGRDPDIKDWFADMAGINLGLFGFFTLRRWLRR